MSRPTARVLALLEILQGGGLHTAADLGARLGVDERTVRRYVTHLVDLDVPIESVRGPYGGLRLAAGFRMPPLMLTEDEAFAVLLGVVAGRRAGVVTTSAEAADSAAAKIRRVLPRALAARLEALFQTADFTAPERDVVTPETSVLLQMAEAARGRHPVTIDYTDRSGRRTTRTVHPYGVVAHAGRWYVIGPDSASGALRSFRLDRVSRVRATQGTFDVPEDFDPTDEVLSGLARTPWRHDVVVEVNGAAAEVSARLPPGLARVEARESGWVRIRLQAERLDWVPSLLAGLGLPFVIQAPAELRELMAAWVGRLAGCVAATDLPAATTAWDHPPAVPAGCARRCGT